MSAEAGFWNDLAAKYAAQPVKDLAAFERKQAITREPGGSFISSNVCLAGTWVPYIAIISVLRWFGKAPMVYCYDRKTILRELREAGFIDVEEPDVGAESTVAFIVAKKPA